MAEDRVEHRVLLCHVLGRGVIRLDLDLSNRAVRVLLEVRGGFLSAGARARLLVVERVLVTRPGMVLVVMMPTCWIATDVCSFLLVVVVADHVGHLAVSELLRLVEASLSVVVFATVFSVELVLDGPHDELVGGRLVRDLFRTHSRVPLLHVLRLIGSWVLMGSSSVCCVRDLATLEIEDVVLDC